MGNALLRCLRGDCGESTPPHRPQTPQGVPHGVAALAHDLFDYEITSKVITSGAVGRSLLLIIIWFFVVSGSGSTKPPCGFLQEGAGYLVPIALTLLSYSMLISETPCRPVTKCTAR